jgi:LDH2 family malate/lactate/ureidoglycolate dehydrogenase
MTRFHPQDLHLFCQRVFESFGIASADAGPAADILVTADLRGIDTHGVARLKSYVELMQIGRINPTPKIRIVRDSPAVATVDGDNGLGMTVARRANEIAMEKAEQVGAGWVAVSNTNHYGIAGYYVVEALKRDLIGFCMTNTTSIVAPLWGAQRRLGTNPIAVAFPALEEPPIVIDMATTSAAFGKVENAIRRNEAIPSGWAVDAEGRPTTDPQDVVAGGALLPMGSDKDRGGHKGYCLSAMVDLLCGPLSGANWGPFTPPFIMLKTTQERTVGKGIGHFFGALKIDAFIDVTEFKRQVDDWIRTFRATKAAPGTEGPIIPGDPERLAEDVNRREGISLLAPVVEDLREVSRRTGVPFSSVH